MPVVSLQARARTESGKGAARKARAAGNIPAILYGPGEEAVPLEISQPDFMKIYHGGHGENVLVDLSVDAGQPRKVLFREVQRDPVTERVMHVDFYHVSLTKPIRVHVPVHLEGTPVGVKDAGGILQHIMREVEVECLPTEIPSFLVVDVSGLEIHQAVHVRDLEKANIKLMDDVQRTVASVIPPVVSREPAAAEAEEAAEEEAAEPERIGDKEAEEKPEEEKTESKKS
jgi:large subunit ribosomal protein L25